MKKIVVCIILCFLLSTFSFASSYLVTEETELKIEPNGEIIGVLSNGFNITEDMIIKTEEPWIKIGIYFDYGYIDGWINSNGLAIDTADVDFPSNVSDMSPFEFNNVKFGGESRIIGEVTNKTDKDYKTIGFRITLYNYQGYIINKNIFVVRYLSSGQTKSFEAILSYDLEKVDTYKIEFSNGF